MEEEKQKTDFINPKTLNEEHPTIWFSDKTSGLMEFLIKFRTKGKYNHVMWGFRKGTFVSQGNTYSEVNMDRYMKKNFRLKGFELQTFDYADKIQLSNCITSKLRFPWWKKAYDWVGIFGQIIGIKSVNIDGLNYCSEDIVMRLNEIKENLSNADLCEVIEKMPIHANPDELNEFLKKHPTHFKLLGYWDSDISYERNIL